MGLAGIGRNNGRLKIEDKNPQNVKDKKVYTPITSYKPSGNFVYNDELLNKGNLRESFFVNQLAYRNTVQTAKRGDFVVNGKYYFELGGKNKTYHQISNLQNSFIAADDIEYGFKNKIPLWLFGLLY